MEMKAAPPTLALLILLTGCGATAPETQPKTPTPAAASETTDPLYEEAVAVAKAIDEIDQRYYYQNKYDPFPEEEYSKYAAGDFMDASKAFYEVAKSEGTKWLSVENATTNYSLIPGVSLEGAEVVLQQCSDGTNAIFEENGQQKKGGKTRSRFFLKRFDGDLKIFKSIFEEGAQCEA
ncbi:hypothetical protein [Propionimicrobium lymphophilum]|uniref:hypothetical protein n=1 Tax=Propionimicrobium lymphophilum TaxID=33012 RepID=UPI00049049A8|nr:hypothetical protein [Propionimicrobium lymphophilum]